MILASKSGWINIKRKQKFTFEDKVKTNIAAAQKQKWKASRAEIINLLLLYLRIGNSS